MKQLLKAILGFNAISIVHLIRSGPQQFFGACRRGFNATRGFEAHQFVDEIPVVSLYEVLGARRPEIRLPIRRYEDGMLPCEQAMVLLSILVVENPDEILEIGTYMGNTTRQMAENRPDAIIHTVDLPEKFSLDNDSEQGLPKDDFHLIKCRIVGREFKEHACESRITQHYADTATWNFQEAGRPTFFFIDGSHTYAYCKNDSEKCFELCDGLGVFLWHDCDKEHPGVVRFVLEWRRMGRDIKRISGTPIAYWKST